MNNNKSKSALALRAVLKELSLLWSWDSVLPLFCRPHKTFSGPSEQSKLYADTESKPKLLSPPFPAGQCLQCRFCREIGLNLFLEMWPLKNRG